MIIISGVISLALMCRLEFIKVLMSCICCLYMITNFSLNPLGVTEFQFKNQENNSTLGYVTKKGNYLWVRFLPIAFFFFSWGLTTISAVELRAILYLHHFSGHLSLSLAHASALSACENSQVGCAGVGVHKAVCPPVPLPVSDMAVMSLTLLTRAPL